MSAGRKHFSCLLCWLGCAAFNHLSAFALLPRDPALLEPAQLPRLEEEHQAGRTLEKEELLKQRHRARARFLRSLRNEVSGSIFLQTATESTNDRANATISQGSLNNQFSLPMTSFIDGSTLDKLATVEAEGLGQRFGGIVDDARFAVVRIQAIVGEVDWLQPFRQALDAPFVGSGFIVNSSDDEIVILTNAHVVLDASVVQVQLPALGQKSFDAYVPLICTVFDLAVVQLKRPQELSQALRQNNGTVRALNIRPQPVSLGMEVAAVGYPLGSSSLKLSRGVISGTELVDDNLCYQTTAPISPGNSGGPLFALTSDDKAEDLQVIGINFASSSSEGAQNINYVVPALHLSQILHEFRSSKENAQNSDFMAAIVDADANNVSSTNNQSSQEVKPVHDVNSQEKHPHYQFRLAPLDVIGSESSEALLSTSGGCESGYFLSRILPTSALLSADPPVPERSFLISIDNTTLDNFGMGRATQFLGDPTSFVSLMTLKENLNDPVALKVCKRGNESTHVVSLRWRPDYKLKIREIEEPHFEDGAMDFEIFAGITFMQMTLNHISELLQKGAEPTISRWSLAENQNTARLIITDVEPGSYASRILTPGMAVESINDARVSTLSDFRKHFTPEGVAWTLQTDQGVFFSVKFSDELTDQVMASAGKSYLLTAAVTEASKKLEVNMSSGPSLKAMDVSRQGIVNAPQAPAFRSTIASKSATRSSRNFLARRSSLDQLTGSALMQCSRVVSGVSSQLHEL